MDYSKIYNDLIESRRNRDVWGYTETHHIVPRSLGGSDSLDNLIKLTAREHYICHYLLLKIYECTPYYYQMLKAFYMMSQCKSDNQYRVLPSRVFHKYREDFAKAMSINQNGENNSQYGTKWYTNLDTNENMKFRVCDIIPVNWVPGRYVAKKRLKLCEHCNMNEVIRARFCEKCMSDKFEERVVYYSKLHELYIKHGFRYIVNNTDYTHKLPNLIRQFKRYVKEYSPQDMYINNKCKKLRQGN